MIVPAWPLVGGIAALPIFLVGLILESGFFYALSFAFALLVWAAIVVGISFHFLFEDLWRYFGPQTDKSDSEDESALLNFTSAAVAVVMAIFPAAFWLTLAFILLQDGILGLTRPLYE